MRARALALTVISLALSACGGSPASPPSLAYSLPATPSVQYAIADTTSVVIDMGGQMMEASTESSGMTRVTFERAMDGLRVTMNVEDLDAQAVNPMTTTTADESDIDGPLAFTLDRRGQVSGVVQPTVSEKGTAFFQGLAIAYSFFPHLPGRGVAPGETWTDTTTFGGTQGVGEVAATRVLTYTVAGDTVVEGKNLLRIDINGTVETSVKGATAGMNFEQTATGTEAGWFLWDVQQGMMVESFIEGDTKGSMDVSVAPYPLDIDVRQTRRSKLQEGM